MEAVNTFLGQAQDAESTAADATFFTVSEGEEVVVTLADVPDLADPTWWVILD